MINEKEATLNDLIILMNRDDNFNAENISDGYHTFGELYKHRIMLYLCLINQLAKSDKYEVTYSDTHHDGQKWEGWLLVTCYNKMTKEQISYHIKDYYKCLLKDEWEVDKAPEWDGHTSDDVLVRLTCWIQQDK